MSVKHVHSRYDRFFKVVRPIHPVTLIMTLIVLAGLISIIVLALSRSEKMQRGVEPSTYNLQATTKDIVDTPLPPQASERAIAAQETASSENSADQKIGVSINGTPIFIPENGTVNKQIPNESGDGNISVSITSNSSSVADISSSSASITVESSTSEVEEGD